MSEPFEKEINKLLQPAYLCAVGDAHLADEEIDDLGEIRGIARRFLQARKAIETYIETGDFEASSKLFDADTPIEHHMNMNMLNMFGGLPPFLDKLHEKRAPIQTEEELFALYKVEAKKIKDPFHQEVALVLMRWVAESDGYYASGESIVHDYFEKECWKLDDSRPHFMRLATEITNGEKHEDEDEDEGLEGLLGMLGEFLDSLEDPADSTRFDTKGGKKNLAPQSAACLTLCICADGEISEEELEAMGSAVQRLMDFYDYDDGQEFADKMSAAMNKVLSDLDFEQGTPPEGIVKFAKRAAKNITDHTLASLTCHFIAEVAGADGLDEGEEEILELFMDAWNVTDDDIADAEENLA
jgi:hypothetical protein